ncbi:MAG: glycoside hydrolase family 5 protein [Longibaculum sp.]
METIRGVNLGGWLVLEKWICDDVFTGTIAEDEDELYKCLPINEIEKRLKEHREKFIQEKDIAKIASYGMNLVRLPIPYTVFGNYEKRSGCIEYVDKLFSWALKYHLKVLLDLHTVPGGQNGLDNSGTTGLCTWHKDEEKVNEVIDLIEALALRYASSKALFGIELLNEPISEVRFESLKKRLDKKYKSKLDQSDYIPTSFLVDFYTNCYKRIDTILNKDQMIIIHDGFRLSEWNHYLPKDKFPRLVIDTHMYLNFISRELKENTSRYYVDFIFSTFLKDMREASFYHPILVGEWTLAHHQSDQDKMTQNMYKRYMQGICALQKMAFEISVGWVFFNYKVNDFNRQNWDLNYVIEQGYF